MIGLEQIAEQFEELGVEPSSEVLAKCIDLCVTYDITDAVEFVEQWVAYSVSNLNGADPTVEYLMEMERKEFVHRKDNLAASKKTKLHDSSRSLYNESSALKIYGSPSMGASMSAMDHGQMSHKDDDDIMDSYICKTPKASKTTLARTPANHNTALFSPASYSPISGTPRSSKHNGSGKPIYTFGQANLINQEKWSSTRQERLKIKEVLTNEPLNSKSKYMHDNLADKSAINGDQFFNIALEICKKHFGNEVEEYDLHNVDVACMDPIKTIGRISCDCDGKLNLSSTILIGTDDSKCRTAYLDFSNIKSYSVFPGQIVMVSGTNPRGKTFNVSEIIAERAIKPPSKPDITEPIKFVIAAGPFTNHDDLLYDHLHDLISYCKDHKPDVVFLIGPFIDAEHNSIANNVLAETFESFFEKMIAGIVEALGETLICMVSSQKDVVSSMVYPTPPNFTRKSYRNVHMLPDPCIVDINSLKIGITSTDIFDQLLEEELSKNAGDKIKRVVNYLLHQGSFYPLHPPANGVCFDSELASKYANLDGPPNVLILPSKQNCFIRDVNRCLAINPGLLTSKTGKGTFARLVVHPQKEEANLASWTAGQIIQI